MDLEQRKQRIVTAGKWAGGLLIGFFVAPFIWIAIGGLLGLIVAAVISFVCWKFNAWFVMKIANWRLKAIKAEAMKNPVETLQNQYNERAGALGKFRENIASFKGSIESFKGELSSFISQFPEEREKFTEQLNKMEDLYRLRVRKYDEAKRSLANFELAIQKADAIWKMTQAAAKMTKAAGMNEEELLNKIKVEAALDSVTESLHSSFADLEISLMDEQEAAATKQLPAPQPNTITIPQPRVPVPVKATVMLLAFSLPLFAATNTPTGIGGKVDIRYNTRVDVDSAGKPKAGVTDVYTLDLNVSNSAIFRGTVSHLPNRVGVVSALNSDGRLTFNIDCHVVNPANPSQTKSVGRLTGVVPIDMKSNYRYSDGSVQVSVVAIGRAQAFDSRFGGIATGKPIKGMESKSDALMKKAQTFYKQARGQTVAITVTNYDLMTFQGHVVAAGPVQIYPEARVDGEMAYDYDRSAWLFKNLIIGQDRVSGSIRWVESPRSGNTRDGEYQFDVRLNEGVKQGESAVFAAAANEAAFFETDPTVTALTGTMKYRDTFARDTVVSSAVTVDLAGNNLTKQQAMNLCKVLLLSSIVPLNAE